MVLTKIQFPENKDNIIDESKFVINSLYPIGFKETNLKGCFMFLFGAYQDYMDKYLYLQILFQTEDALEYEMIKKHPNYIPNYEKDPAQKTAYLHMISKMADDNLYATDFIMDIDYADPSYHLSKAIRKVNKETNEAELLDLYIPKNTYVRLKIFLENLNVRSGIFSCEVFGNPRFNNPIFITIQDIRRDETAYAANRQLFVDTHYEMYSGPDTFRMNYRTFINKDKKLANELDQDFFASQYSTNYYIEYIIKDEDDILFIYDDVKLRYDKEEESKAKSVYVCRIPKELVDKTNFLDQYNKIYI